MLYKTATEGIELTKITVFGGDLRMRVAAAALRERGFAVDTSGLYEGDCADCISSDIFLLPVPATRDGRTVAAPLTDKIIPLSFIEQAAAERLVLSSVWQPAVKNYIDYYKDNAYAVANAVPTAEGAVRLAIELTDFTLADSRVLVIGYGRCGRVLCDRLSGLKCRLTVAARRPEVLAEIAAFGAEAIHTDSLPEKLGDFDIVINTADAPLLNGADSKAVIIDISTHGCCDKETAQALNYHRAPGLPGKIAPRSAGIILADTAERLINEYMSAKENKYE